MNECLSVYMSVCLDSCPYACMYIYTWHQLSVLKGVRWHALASDGKKPRNVLHVSLKAFENKYPHPCLLKLDTTRLNSDARYN